MNYNTKVYILIVHSCDGKEEDTNYLFTNMNYIFNLTDDSWLKESIIIFFISLKDGLYDEYSSTKFRSLINDKTKLFNKDYYLLKKYSKDKKYFQLFKEILINLDDELSLKNI